MKKRTVIVVALCVALALSFTMMAAGCDKKEAPAEEPAASETSADEDAAATDEPATDQVATDAAAETPAASDEVGGVPNPQVEATPDQIKDKFSIEFLAPDEYADGAKYSIIDDTIAQMEYSMDSGKGPIQVTYRVSRTDAEQDISGDYNTYEKDEQVALDDGQNVTVRSNDSTGPASCVWYNENVVGGGLSASLYMDPVEQESQLTDVANFFVSQESKGF
jgi:hypothetical protein